MNILEHKKEQHNIKSVAQIKRYKQAYLKISICTTIFLLFFSCGNNMMQTSELIQTENNLKDSTKNNMEFREFWRKFRSLIIDSTQVPINQLFKVPFIIKGFEDTDPKITLNDFDSINSIFTTFLHQDNISNDSFTSHYQLIKSIVTIENHKEYPSTGKNMSIENMDFNNTKSGWRLCRIYMNTKDYKK